MRGQTDPEALTPLLPGQQRSKAAPFSRILIGFLSTLIEYLAILLVIAFPAIFFFAAEQAMRFALDISASTPEQSASRIASLESAFLVIYGFINFIGFIFACFGFFAAVAIPFQVLFDNSSSTGFRCIAALAIPTVFIIVPSLILMEAGIVRNHLDQMPKDRRNLWQFRWLADFTLAPVMALVILAVNEEHSREMGFGETGFTMACIFVLFLVWWGFFIGGTFPI
jgi:hypothetical protein